MHVIMGLLTAVVALLMLQAAGYLIWLLAIEPVYLWARKVLARFQP